MDVGEVHNGHDGNLKHLCILVVDDENDARDLMVIMLSHYGAMVETAASAEEALRKFKEQHWLILPDIIVSDIGMPDMDGYYFIEELRKLNEEQGGNIPAIALTGFCSTTDKLRTLTSGFQAHLAKPVEPDKLVSLICKVTNLTGKRI
ncbi:MAG: response regulator [Acidobacteriota bacterium]